MFKQVGEKIDDAGRAVGRGAAGAVRRVGVQDDRAVAAPLMLAGLAALAAVAAPGAACAACVAGAAASGAATGMIVYGTVRAFEPRQVATTRP